ncbi:MAG TPA: dihydrofolate reductase [Sphingobacteriaceae bacterium]|nr:dihydrofolate reductase [Sphingobacteriaceae bacterium]
MTKISIIVATSENHGIGKNNQLLWHLPNDLKFFKKITSGHTIIMGRKTFESIGRPLPNRRNIVITRQKGLIADGVETAASISEALKLTSGEPEVFIIGGAEIYRQTLDHADRIYLTKVSVQLDADAFFPLIDPKQWQIIAQEDHAADEKHAYSYSFVILDRIHS